MKRILLLSFCCVVLLIAEGCEHKQLCYDHHHGVATRIYVDWSKAPEQPTGMSVYAYPYDGGECVLKRSNTTEYADLRLKDGDYHIVVFNQIPSEFETIGFGGLETFENAYAYALDRSKSWYQRADNERVVEDAEWLGSGSIGDVFVNNLEMHRKSMSRADSRFVVLGEVQPQSRIVEIKVTVHVKGIQNIRSMRGSLDGLAGGCMLSNGAPLNEKVTHLLEKWEAKVDEHDGTQGELICYITSFGLPGEHQELSEENTLKLSAKLVDNKTIVDFVFKVGERFEVNTEVGIELDLEVGTDQDDGPIPLPDVKPEGGGGGFDIGVDDWGEVENVEIPVS